MGLGRTATFNANQPTPTALATANTERGPTELLWGATGSPSCFVTDWIESPRLGLYCFDDFECSGQLTIYPAGGALVQGSINKWGAIAPAGGGFGDAGIVGGAIQLAPGSLAISSTNQDTVVLYSNVGAYQITSASSGAGLQGRLAFEARVALTSVTGSTRDAFIGLVDQAPQSSAAGQALLPFTIVSGGTSNALTSTRNLIGFYNPSSGGGQDWGFVFQLASTAPVIVTNLQSLVSKVTGTAIAAGTYYKLGFVYDPQAPVMQISSSANGQTVGNSARAMLKVFVNGVQAAAFLTQAANILTASFPTGVMGPIAALAPAVSGSTNTGTASAGLMNLDWLRLGQNLIA